MKVLNTLTPPPNFKSRRQLAAENNTRRRAGGNDDRRAGGGANESTDLSPRLYSATSSLTGRNRQSDDMAMRRQLDRLRAEHRIGGPDAPVNTSASTCRTRDREWLRRWSRDTDQHPGDGWLLCRRTTRPRRRQIT